MPPPPIPGSARQLFTQITNPALQTSLIQRAVAPPATIRDHEHKRFRYVNNYDTLQHYGIVDGDHTGTTVSLIGLITAGPERLITVEDENYSIFVGPPRDLKRVWAGGARRTRRRATKRKSQKSRQSQRSQSRRSRD